MARPVKVRLLETWPYAEYRSDVVEGWPRGESRAVSQDIARYLLKTFPSHFKRVRGTKGNT